MIDDKVRSTSDIQWASVSAYLQWLEVQAGLTPFPVSAVYSFKVTRSGFSGLAKSKILLAGTLRENLRKIELWVQGNSAQIEETEMVFVRSLWRTTKDALEIVKDHVIRAQRLTENYADYGKVLPREETDPNEPLF